MTSTSLLMNARRLGQHQPLVSDKFLTYPPILNNQPGAIPLHDLISHIVTEEATAFTQQAAKQQREQSLYHVMTAQQIAQTAVNGHIKTEPRANRNTITPEQAVQTALQAFQDGLFYFFIDNPNTPI